MVPRDINLWHLYYYTLILAKRPRSDDSIPGPSSRYTDYATQPTYIVLYFPITYVKPTPPR